MCIRDSFQAAPAAEMAAIGTFGKVFAAGPASGHASLRAHWAYSIYRRSQVPKGTRFGWAASNSLGKLAEVVQIRIYSANARAPGLRSRAVAPGPVSAGPSPLKSGQFGRRVVSMQSSKYLIAIILTGVLGPAPARMFGQAAAAPSSAQPQKNWKDRAEFDAYDAITKDTNPKTRLEKLKAWEMAYPMTEFITERRTLFLTTYVGLNDAKNAVEEAKQIPVSYTHLDVYKRQDPR